MQWRGHEGAATQLRLVLDTNVLVSVLVFGGSLNWIQESWRTGLIKPLESLQTTVELIGVLSYSKFNLDSAEIESFLSDYLPWAEMVDVPEGLGVPDPRDPNDRPFLGLAIADNADALVTGDTDLLVLAPEFPIPIITPRELREKLVAQI